MQGPSSIPARSLQDTSKTLLGFLEDPHRIPTGALQDAHRIPMIPMCSLEDPYRGLIGPIQGSIQTPYGIITGSLQDHYWITTESTQDPYRVLTGPLEGPLQDCSSCTRSCTTSCSCAYYKHMRVIYIMNCRVSKIFLPFIGHRRPA